ncbi:MAG: alanine racemase [Candidatus Muirbacterium halophilum]|nr:alanine racemase [Candidatus Muirbacterium halophilum]
MKNIFNIPTPFIKVNNKKLYQNIKKIQMVAQKNNSKLYPHFKTHKSLFIADRQIFDGAEGITSAKISEAEILVEKGISNIIIAYPIVSKFKMNRFLNIYEKADISLIIDSFRHAELLNSFFIKRGVSDVNCFVKIDTGLNRLGFTLKEKPEIQIPKIFQKCKNLNFKGILSHAGHSYSATNIECVKKIGIDEEKYMNLLNESLKKSIGNSIYSTGATPVVSVLEDFKAEIIRPGNYVFYDNTALSIGYADINECALRVVSQVISVRGNKIVIDAGSKTLGLDKGVHSSNIIKDYGAIIRDIGSNNIEKDFVLSRLSEEHGIIETSIKNNVKIGDYIEIIPNHSCYVMNLFDDFYIVDNDEITVIDKIKVDARGKVE